MTTKEIANRFIELCRKGDFSSVQKDLFSEDAVSIEPHSTPAFDKETKGLQAIIGKGEKWKDMVKESHEISVSGPVIAGSSFACAMRMHVTMKEAGEMDMTELCVYKIKDGKIVSEEFFM